ncbi:hypothetical protein RDWZM_001467 [Blomia tropicalis]|uniref:tRNA-uridine aminocarboxypropyltransferase 1 n=1 Tax=Blomia tropicalis TaxID=40697 RepID=A0A9Q0MC83_BLOTA|nr:hypothetical protein RDWZM_001467 [Blomia tropicalis]
MISRKKFAENDTNFLLEFTNFTSTFDVEDDETQLENEEWANKCFGRGTTVRRDFKSHLNSHFVEKCSGNIGEHSFDQFKISSGDILKQIDERYICSECCKSRRFFCYTCYTISPKLDSHLPQIKLPVRIDIIKHIKEIDGKSTCSHALIMAREQVRVFRYPNLPNDWSDDPQKTLLIFPRKGAPTLSQYLDQHYKTVMTAGLDSDVQRKTSTTCSSMNSITSNATSIMNTNICLSTSSGSSWNQCNDHLCFDFPFERVVFVDSTWRQSKTIMNDLRFKRLPAVAIDAEQTRFWRCDQRRPITFLSTIEAIYYFCVQLHTYMSNMAVKENSSISSNDFAELHKRFPPYDGQYDNILFFFKHTFNVIKNRYKL